MLLPADFTKAQEDFVPLSLRGVKLQKSEVSWSDIGGKSRDSFNLRARFLIDIFQVFTKRAKSCGKRLSGQQNTERYLPSVLCDCVLGKPGPYTLNPS